MKYIIEPLITSIENQNKAIGNLVEIGIESVERLTNLNASASLAAIDNTVHHLETLAMSKDFDDVVELQIKSVLPALESVKAYAGQVLGLSGVTSRTFGYFVENNLLRL